MLQFCKVRQTKSQNKIYEHRYFIIQNYNNFIEYRLLYNNIKYKNNFILEINNLIFH